MTETKYTCNGESHTAQEWADILGIKLGTFRSRVRRYGIYKAVNIDVIRSKKRFDRGYEK